MSNEYSFSAYEQTRGERCEPIEGDEFGSFIEWDSTPSDGAYPRYGCITNGETFIPYGHVWEHADGSRNYSEE